MQPGERSAPSWFIDVGIDLQRGADPAVPKDDLGVAGRDVEVLKQRGNDVPQMVDLDRPEFVGVADATEGPDEVARLDRPSGPGGEDQVCCWSGRAHVGPVGGLLCDPTLQGLAGEVEQWHVTLAGSCLDRPEDQLALDALKLLADLDRARVGIDVGPAQAEGLAATQAIEDEQHECGAQRIGPGRTEELLGLVSAPGPDGATLPCGDHQDGLFADLTTPGVLFAIRVPLGSAVGDTALAEPGEGSGVALALSGEHARVGGDGAGDAFTAGQPGSNDLPGIILVNRLLQPFGSDPCTMSQAFEASANDGFTGRVHIGSAYEDVELEVLRAAARQGSAHSDGTN